MNTSCCTQNYITIACIIVPHEIIKFFFFTYIFLNKLPWPISINNIDTRPFYIIIKRFMRIIIIMV